MAGIKRWNGSSWVPIVMKKWAAGAWNSAVAVKKWNGSAWTQIYPTITAPATTVSRSGTVVKVAGIRLNTDGTWQRRDETGYSAGGSWITPNAAASSSYDVRITSVSFLQGSVFWTSAAAADTWVSLGSSCEWSVRDADSTGNGWTRVTFNFEIRKGGVTLSTGACELNANYEIV